MCRYYIVKIRKERETRHAFTLYLRFLFEDGVSRPLPWIFVNQLLLLSISFCWVDHRSTGRTAREKRWESAVPFFFFIFYLLRVWLWTDRGAPAMAASRFPRWSWAVLRERDSWCSAMNRSMEQAGERRPTRTPSSVVVDRSTERTRRMTTGES